MHVVDNLPAWLAASLIIVLSLSALYLCYIRPGYSRDRQNRR